MACLHCTGYGKGCCMEPAGGRTLDKVCCDMHTTTTSPLQLSQAGNECGCGSGEAGCERCRRCKTCCEANCEPAAFALERRNTTNTDIDDKLMSVIYCTLA